MNPVSYYEPSLKSLAELLKLAAQAPKICHQKGLVAHQLAQNYDVKRVSQLLEAQIKSILNPIKSDLFKPALAYTGHIPDFDFFRPSVLPQFKPNAYFGVLMMGCWKPFNWRSLIRALKKVSQLELSISLKLTFIPLDVACELAESELIRELETLTWRPQFEINVLEPPAQASAIRKLYQDQSCFIDLDPDADGQWHILAQLMGINCISSGQFALLKPPFSQVCCTSDPDEIAWRLSAVMKVQHQTAANALAIREHTIAQFKADVLGEAQSVS